MPLVPPKVVQKASRWGANQAFGGGTYEGLTSSKPAQYSQPIPEDIKGLRKQQIDLLTKLLGGGGADEISKYFGGIGSPQTGLQRQAGQGIEQFMNQPAPEQRALETSMPMLQNILAGKPGQGVIDALQPHFERNLASANQQGGRFGSANAVMRSRAVDDFNLLGAKAAEQGQQTQLQASQMLALLSNQAGQNPFNRMMGAYGIGQQDAQQADLETQRRIQLMAMLMGGAQGAAFNVPFVQTQPYQPPAWQQFLQMLAQAGGAAAGAKAGG